MSSISIVESEPSGATMSRLASFTTDGADGGVQYTTTVDDLTESGPPTRNDNEPAQSRPLVCTWPHTRQRVSSLITDLISRKSVSKH